jgi:hypothetical protein
MQNTSSGGQAEKTTVGLSVRPVVEVTGRRFFQTRSTWESGRDETPHGSGQIELLNAWKQEKPEVKFHGRGFIG